jgi:hypothetical protein
VPPNGHQDDIIIVDDKTDFEYLDDQKEEYLDDKETVIDIDELFPIPEVDITYFDDILFNDD